MPKPDPTQTMEVIATININVNVGQSAGALPILQQILTQIGAMKMTLDDVLAKVTNQTTVEAGFGVVLDQLVAQDTDIANQLRTLLAGGGTIDPAKLQAISDALDKNIQSTTDAQTKAAAAVVANTVAAPTP